MKLDLGCGPNKQAGFLGVDCHAFPGVDVVHDLTKTPWPWDDGSIDEVHCSHFYEHLDATERMRFMNELWRILKPGEWVNGQPTGGFARIIVPDWASCRAYGDPTHKWPPCGIFMAYYWDRNWRASNAPHCDAQWLPGGYNCHFEFVAGPALNPALSTRNQQYQQFAAENYKEAIHDLWFTVVKKA